MMNAATREHYRAEAQSFEQMAKRADTQLRIMRQRGDATAWKIEGLEECASDAREAAADFRRILGAA